MTAEEKTEVTEDIRYLQDNEIKNKRCDTEHPFAFISYAHNDDVPVIRRIFSELYDSGFNLWIDTANLPVDGNTWEKAAVDALASPNCKLLIFFRSQRSLVKSTIQREIGNFAVNGRTSSDIITVDLSHKEDMHTEEFMKSLENTDSEKFKICQSVCNAVSSHCNALRYYHDYHDMNDFLGALIGELNGHSFRQNFSIQEKVEFILEGTFHINMNAEQKRIMKRYRFLLKECMADPTLKRSLLIIGKPGVGKTVMAMMMLNEYICMKKQTVSNELSAEDIKFHLITKNNAPRDTYKGILTSRRNALKKTDPDGAGHYKQLFDRADVIFRSAQGLEDRYTQENQVDVIVVDEAHRLEEHAQYEGNRNEKKNQPEAVAKIARLSVFFCDPDQMVTFDDFGSPEHLKRACVHDHAENSRYFIEKMNSQMRCGGEDSYMEWVDCLLQMDGHDEPDAIGKSKDYDLRVFDDPCEMFEAIRKKNEQDCPARVVAGMCWPWEEGSRGDPESCDVIIQQYHFEKSWNLDYLKCKDKTKRKLNFVSDPDSVEQIGCVHTVQGLELTYVGVIIGMDMGFENGKVITREKFKDYANRIDGVIQSKSTNYSNPKLLNGAGALYKEYQKEKRKAKYETDKIKYHEQMSKADQILEEYRQKCHNVLRNVYRILLTRGTKGCYIFCCDPQLQKYIKEQAERFNESLI